MSGVKAAGSTPPLPSSPDSQPDFQLEQESASACDDYGTKDREYSKTCSSWVDRLLFSPFRCWNLSKAKEAAFDQCDQKSKEVINDLHEKTDILFEGAKKFIEKTNKNMEDRKNERLKVLKNSN